MAKIFISHSVKDKELADALVDLLQTGIGINANDIFCSSLEGLGIPGGTNFIDFIKNELSGTEVVILLLTPNYRYSVFCNCELGASWALGINVLPLLVPPLDYSDMKAVLTGTQAYKIDNSADLSEMRDWLVEKLGIKEPVKTPRWEVKRDVFTKKLPSFLKELVHPVVDREKYDSLQEKYQAALKRIEELEQEIKKKNKLLEQLKKVKSREEVDKVLLDSTKDEWEKFIKLVSIAQQSLKKVSSIVRKAIYKHYKMEKLEPKFLDSWEYSELEDAIDRQLIICFDDNRECDINLSHPLIEEITEKLDGLKNFLEKETSMDFFELYREKYKHNPDFLSKDFWEEHLLL